MIITNLKGGLGNQMFQYALGKILALKNNDVLKLDIEGLEKLRARKDEYRIYRLDHFNIKATLANREEVQRLKYPYGVVSKALRKFQFKVLRQFHMGYEPHILKKKGDIYLDGFWQSYKYYEDYRHTLLEDFSLKKTTPNFNKLKEKIQDVHSVALHVRRGDFYKDLKNRLIWGITSPEYYMRSLDYIKDNEGSFELFVFTDDIDWVQEHIHTDYPITIVSSLGFEDYEELLLMSHTKHNVISNSSFSWWGAWLNQNPDKIVIAPKLWNRRNPRQFKTITPPSWIRL